jgi:hypothetical protein
MGIFLGHGRTIPYLQSQSISLGVGIEPSQRSVIRLPIKWQIANNLSVGTTVSSFNVSHVASISDPGYTTRAFDKSPTVVPVGR